MTKPGRNDLCHCGSGRKYKKCHGPKEAGGGARGLVLMIVIGGAMLAALAIAIARFNSDATGSGARTWDPAHGHYHDANGQEVR